MKGIYRGSQINFRGRDMTASAADTTAPRTEACPSEVMGYSRTLNWSSPPSKPSSSSSSSSTSSLPRSHTPPSNRSPSILRPAPHHLRKLASYYPSPNRPLPAFSTRLYHLFPSICHSVLIPGCKTAWREQLCIEKIWCEEGAKYGYKRL